ncbi:MAG: HNH endonuclease family protein [Chloroherpetonaceae bacterium]
MSLYDKIDFNNYLYSIQLSLLQRKGNQRFPKDKELIDALKVKDVYNIKSKNRTYLLERLENYENKEPVEIEGNKDITIEHIFPQNPDQKWKMTLGEDEYKFIQDNYLNTIGNLTLSGNNGKLSNKSFLEKRDLKDVGYKDSRLWLNKFLTTLDKWGKSEIEQRFDILAERFIKIWSIPKIEITEQMESNEINIFEAEDPKFKRLDYAVFFNKILDVNQVSKLYVEVFKQLFELQPETFFTTELGAKIGLTKHPTEDNLRQPIAINDIYFIESNFGNSAKFDRIKMALSIFDIEDELMIKYMDE